MNGYVNMAVEYDSLSEGSLSGLYHRYEHPTTFRRFREAGVGSLEAPAFSALQSDFVGCPVLRWGRCVKIVKEC